MKKVLVIGCPGSGKSVFSCKLAAKVRLPVIHLDAIYHQKIWNEDKSLKKQQWREEIIELIRRDAWIMDGNYKSTLDIRVPAADTVFFLDYPRYVSLGRSFRRQWEYRKKRRPDMSAEWKEHMSWDFLRFMWNYRRIERPKVLALLEEYRAGRNISILSNHAEAEQLLRSL